MENIVLIILLWFGIYYIVTLSLNIEFGYGGIPNFGKALSVIVGAISVGSILNRLIIFYYGIKGDFIEATTYGVAKINAVIAQNPVIGFLILIVAIIIAAFLGFVVGMIFILPSAKLKADYLGVTLLAISETVFLICVYNLSIMGGYFGVSVPNILAFVESANRGTIYTGLVLVFTLLVYLFVRRLVNTPYGRVLRAMRENDEVTESFGRNLMKLRMWTMGIGSALGAIAGVLYCFYTENIVANAFTRVEWTFFPFLMILLGGKGNNKGVALGTLVYVIVMVLLDIYKYNIKEFFHIPIEPVWLTYIFFGIVMLLILYYRPKGLLPEKPIFTSPIKKVASNT